MNKDLLNSVKEEVYGCSKCGLCQCVCPVYLAEKNEMFLPRGRFIVLNNLFNNKKSFSRKFVKDIDICLNCNLCKNFCPSNIDTAAVNILVKNAAKYKYSIISFSLIYKIMLIVYKLLHLSNFKPQIKGNSNMKAANKGNVVFFEGCYNRYINNSDKNAALNLIEKCGYNVSKVISNCCGYPYLQEGNIGKFKKNAQKIIGKIPENASYIVCSCDSCHDTLKKVLNTDWQDKLIRLDELLKLNDYKLSSDNKVMYFKPLIRNEETYLPSSSLIMNKKGMCSLMENFFIYKYGKIADRITKETFASKDEIDNKTIFTSCLLSKQGLEKQIKKIKSNAKVYTYAEYIETLEPDNR